MILDVGPAMACATQISLRPVESGSRLVLPQRTSRRIIKCTVRASNQDSDANVVPTGRRLALASLLGAGILAAGTENADAKGAPARDYYQELLESSKNKPSTSDLLQKYQQLNAEPAKPTKGGKKPAATKPSFKTAAAPSKKPSYATASKTSSAAASAGAASFNPVEVGLGLAAVAGAVLVGRKSDKKDGASKPASAPAKRGTVVRPAPTPVKKAGTVVKKAPVPPPSKAGTVVRGGTVVRSVAPPSRPGTIKKAGMFRSHKF